MRSALSPLENIEQISYHFGQSLKTGTYLRSMAKKQKSKKTATEITDTVEVRIVELSLQNPDYGGGRLVPLLEQEGIMVTSSAVYTILKRNNLQNKTLRLARLEALGAAEVVPEPADTIEPPAEVEAPVPDQTDEITPPPWMVAASKILPNLTGRRFWSFTLPGLLVLGVVGYFCISAATNFLRAGREPALVPQSAPVEATSKADDTARSLEDYSIITERNLFGGSETETPALEEEVSVEGIPTAEKNLGLKLIGTVAGDDADTSFAIIDNKKTRKQELYHEGDKAGEVLIKRILRNKVIIDAGSGEELLTLELEETGKKVEFSPASQPAVSGRRTASRKESIQFDRAEVEAALANVDQVIQELNITPFVRAGKPTGFRIGTLPRDSILIGMGLRSGDRITGVNDQAITSPEQAAEFFQTIKQGGDVTIKVSKGRGVRMRGRVIRLKIE
jgi:general secretion pathway protein C